MGLAGKVAIVTGAATGIGRGIARRLAADGASIIVNHLNTPDAAQAVCAEITQAGGTASEFSADVSVRAEHDALVAAAIDRWGGWDILVANGAVAPQLVRIFAHEIGHRGITVNAVAPGATATETYAAGRGEELVRRFAAMSAFDRLGTVEEIADVVAYLASDSSRWITGQIIRANGGTV